MDARPAFGPVVISLLLPLKILTLEACSIADCGTVKDLRKAHNWQTCQVVGAFPAPIYA